MDKLAAMRTFVRVARAGSFVDAAEQLGMAKSAVSRQIAELEAQLGVSLMQRTTRRLTLTQVGESYLSDCMAILNALEKAEERAALDVSRSDGILRLGAPLSFGTRQLPGILTDFQEKYPDIAVDLSLLSRNVDPAEAGFDLVIHIWGKLPQAAVARKIAQSCTVACAAPSYLARYGEPKDPSELVSHRCLIAKFNGVRTDSWPFANRDGGQVDVKVSGRLECNQTSVLLSAALAGQGIIFLPTYIVGDDIANGSLIPLFPHCHLYRQNIYAVYMSGVHVPARTRFLIDFMLEKWGTEPHWDRWLKNRDFPAPAGE